MRGAALLFVLCLALSGVIAYQLITGPGEISPVAPGVISKSKSTRPPLPEVRERSEAVYARVVEQNLFDPERRPTKEVVAPQPRRRGVQTAETPGFQLKGIVITPQGHSALIKLPGELRYRTVVKGQEIEGWIVKSIGVDQISVNKAGTSTVVQLKAP